MTKRDNDILSQIKEVAHSVVPQGGKALLYGSRARGDASKGSDWDILIILRKPQLNQVDYDNVSYPFVELGWRIGAQISPIIYTMDEWTASSITPFYDNVMRDGINLV